MHDACACVAKPCAHTVRLLFRTMSFQRRPFPTAEAALVRYSSRARRCDCGAFNVRLDCFQLVGTDFRLSLHLNIDVSGAENHNMMSSCLNLAAAPSGRPGWWWWMMPLRRTRGSESQKISRLLHGKGHDVGANGANDADNGIRWALHSANSGYS